jgi:fatty-acyl-CoA synthase
LKYHSKTYTNGKLSYAYTTSNIPLFHQTLAEHLELKAKEDPDRIAFIFDGENENDSYKLSYKQLRDKSVLLGQNMMRMGFKKGDSIIISFPITHETIVFYFACAYTGIIAVPIEHQFTSTDELKYTVDKIKPVAFLIWQSIKFDKHLLKNEEIFKEILSFDSTKKYLKNIIVLGDNSNDLNKYESCSYRVTSYRDISTKRLNQNGLDFPLVDLDDELFILFSSGTTSVKKAIVIRNNLVNYLRISRYCVSHSGPRKSTSLASINWYLFHLSGLMSITSNIVSYSTMILPLYEISAINAMRVVHRYKPSFLSAGPKVLVLI